MLFGFMYSFCHPKIRIPKVQINFPVNKVFPSGGSRIFQTGGGSAKLLLGKTFAKTGCKGMKLDLWGGRAPWIHH